MIQNKQQPAFVQVWLCKLFIVWQFTVQICMKAAAVCDIKQ